ncbi:cytochrome C oxidase subunit IV family protein [Mechercharimyces sp. CAU 1602]|uniref:cytochrome C oxidase subunit IV family protein n=1 Tax=Mechercharimyces sp. CAU 1602 TaxID=2973933 RepID=UPI00216261E8|nr:cytochrome C oxidase subunit IV family protein [Mechercharimyces sp. CAU 1602]MCS1352758.1 cytochrome C oxidase subunit IV family protein [Mechercharimyces sp. CAU 1602]
MAKVESATNSVSSHAGSGEEKKQILSFAIMILLTVVAFAIVMLEIVPAALIIPIILFLAVIQVFLQLFTFMHLNQKGSAAAIIFISTGMFVAIISAVGIMILK